MFSMYPTILDTKYVLESSRRSKIEDLWNLEGLRMGKDKNTNKNVDKAKKSVI